MNEVPRRFGIRTGGRKSMSTTTANSLLQAGVCCGTASEMFRRGQVDESMDQARLALRFLIEVLGEEGDSL